MIAGGGVTKPGDSSCSGCSWGAAGCFFFKDFPIVVVQVSVDDMPGDDFVDQDENTVNGKDWFGVLDYHGTWGMWVMNVTWGCW